MLNLTKKVLLIAILALARVAVGHEGHDHGADQDKHVKGTVESIAGSALKVKSTDGKKVDVHVDDNTQYENAGAPGKLSDLKVGAKVVVHGEPMKDGTLHAKEVRFGKAKTK